MTNQSQKEQGRKSKKLSLQSDMEWIVREEFKDIMVKGTIVISVEEMARVIINVLASYMEMKRQAEKLTYAK